MRVKLGENLPIQLKRLFTESGHDAATVVDEGLRPCGFVNGAGMLL